MNNKEIKRANKSTGVWDRDRYEKAKYAESTKQAEGTSGKSLEEMVDDLLRAVGFDIDPDDDGSFELTQDVEEKINEVAKNHSKQVQEDINQILTSELKLANISEIQPKLRANIGQF